MYSHAVDKRQQPGSEDYKALPAEDITIDQVVAWNMRRWRRATGMKQEELGELIGWSAANISAAERSVEGHRDRRRFDAQTTAEIADALRIPLVALYMPPEDDGIGKRYQWRTYGGGVRDMASLMQTVMHDNKHESEVMEEYKDRYRASVAAYLDDEWGTEAVKWFLPMDDPELRAEYAAMFRAREATNLRLAAEDKAFADRLEGLEADLP